MKPIATILNKTIIILTVLLVSFFISITSWASHQNNELATVLINQKASSFRATKTALYNENSKINIGDFRHEMDQLIKNKIRRNLHKKIFDPSKKDSFLLKEIQVDKTDDQYIYKINVPKIHQDTVRVFIKNNAVVIFNRLIIDKNQNLITRYIKKQRYAYFQKTIPLPKNADRNTIVPVQENGVMIIKFDTKKEKDRI